MKTNKTLPSKKDLADRIDSLHRISVHLAHLEALKQEYQEDDVYEDELKEVKQTITTKEIEYVNLKKDTIETYIYFVDNELDTINETLRKILLELDKINLREAVPSPDEIEDAILEVVSSHEKSWVAKWHIKHMLNYIPAEMIDNAIEYLCENKKLTHDMRMSDWVRIPKVSLKISKGETE